MFDQNHRIVGQLHGGQASCTNISWDKYGKIAYSWLNNNNASANKRLKDWLDPNNSGAITLDGRYFNTPDFTLDLALNSVVSPKPANNCLSSVHTEVKIRNNGETTITSAKIYYEINGNLQSFDWTGSLAFGSSETVVLPEVDLAAGNHTFRAFVSSPNNSTDLNTANDTIAFDFSTEIGSPVIVNVLTDNNPDETTWVIKKEDGTIVQSNPTLAETTTYTQELCLENGCYDFVIYDSGNNGLNGMFGFMYVGSYSLSVGSQIIDQSAEGANFGAKDSTHFCINDVSVKNYNSNAQVFVYPNPATEQLNIRFMDNIPANSKIEIYDYTGRAMVEQMTVVNQLTSVNIANFNSGLYYIIIKSGDIIIQKPFVKMK